jgi:hypothetical protein
MLKIARLRLKVVLSGKYIILLILFFWTEQVRLSRQEAILSRNRCNGRIKKKKSNEFHKSRRSGEMRNAYRRFNFKKNCTSPSS